MKHGFSLVELSIVLVILGLLTGGILTGQNLIRAAELRSVTTEYSGYQTAVNTFRDKYFQLPGDMNNATDFWGAINSAPATCRTTASTGTLTCSGNGDGVIETMDGSVTFSERKHFWKQLSNAGLIEGNYTAVAGSAGNQHIVLGENAPRSKLSNAGYSIMGLGTLSGDLNHYDGSYGNTLFFGAQGTANQIAQLATISPEEAWNIDTKIDDGKPAYGKVLSYKPAVLANCATSATESLAEYQLSFSGTACVLIFRDAF